MRPRRSSFFHAPGVIIFGAQTSTAVKFTVNEWPLCGVSISPATAEFLWLLLERVCILTAP